MLIDLVNGRVVAIAVGDIETVIDLVNGKVVGIPVLLRVPVTEVV